MQMPAILEGESLTRLVQGAIAGFIATVVIGFTWGGWTLESTAKQQSEKHASATLVAVLAPMCADKFKGASDAAMQDSYIQKGGWATFPGMAAPDLAIAQACAKLLST
jgi:hypothetical protein